jgi:hypothetical protein
MMCVKTANEQKRDLRIQDLICQSCHSEVTCSKDRVCQICKAIGKTWEPETETSFWEDIEMGIHYAEKRFFGLKG